MSTRITLIQVAALAGAHKTSSATLVRAACNVQRAATVASANQLKNYAQLTRRGSRQAGVKQSVVKWACGRQRNKLNATATTSATMTANKCATALHALPCRPSVSFLSHSLPRSNSSWLAAEIKPSGWTFSLDFLVRLKVCYDFHSPLLFFLLLPHFAAALLFRLCCLAKTICSKAVSTKNQLIRMRNDKNAERQ